ncbi:Vat family streptogramin A O-acetyltransferase [Utexia brackfieldae]|uniref:Vat family streptogramin A O-acetyltransferase n=1 Tax=Utexia brackfieldae TaxID=3074108 RepID=UPI00370DB49F
MTEINTNLGPAPTNVFPLPAFKQVCYINNINNIINDPNIIVGDYSYYDDPDGAQLFTNNVLYHYPFIGDKLIIGKFCAIARGVKFIMNGANHKLSGFSTYPFQIFGHGWESVQPTADELPFKGDMVIGHDVWIGYNVTMMPGVRVGNGAIIAAQSVVVDDVPAYSIVGGNPAKVLKRRFAPEIIAALEQIAWWDWPIAHITRHLTEIVGQDIEALKQAAKVIKAETEMVFPFRD